MERIQFYLTVPEGKWFIAHGIAQMPQVRAALEYGKVMFKGGTTVSAVSELLAGHPLRISGRLTSRGSVAAKKTNDSPHGILYEKGNIQNVDSCFHTALLEFSPDDVMIIGANIIDAQGGAAMLAGRAFGGDFGMPVSAASIAGFHVIVAAGLEKLIPGSVWDSIRLARLNGVDRSRGMACGLFPVIGTVVTELTAVRLISDVQVQLIGRGGVHGAEGGSLLQAWGTSEEIHRLEDVLNQCYNKPLSGDPQSMTECSYPSEGCGKHLSCSYKAASKKEV